MLLQYQEGRLLNWHGNSYFLIFSCAQVFTGMPNEAAYQKLVLLVSTADGYLSGREAAGSSLNASAVVEKAIRSCFMGQIRPVSLL